MRSALYQGLVRHQRFGAKKHALKYRVFMTLIDLDEIESLDRGLKLFGYNRRARASFHDTDHADGSGTPLRPHIESLLKRNGLESASHRIALLAMPRLFGYVFNPLSVYFCWDSNDALAAIVYEVKNTFGERHDYVLQASGSRPKQACDKSFFVSPFLPMGLRYEFEIQPPDERVIIAMRVFRGDRLALTASFAAERRPLTDAELARAIAAHPLMTFGAIAAIHWEALKMLFKGIPYLGRAKPKRPKRPDRPETLAATP